MDIPGIRIIVQYGASCNLCMLWQPFGQVAQGVDQEAIVILLFEKKYLALEIEPLNAGQTGTAKKVSIGQKHKAASQLTTGTQK